MAAKGPIRRLWHPAMYRIPPLHRLMAERDELRREVKQTRAQKRRLARERRSLQRQLADRDAQLASLRQQGTDSGRKTLRYLFIVTYGRSGSTLLQGILSSTPGILIRGENANALYHLYRFHRTCSREQQTRRGTLTPRHPQFGIQGYPGALALADIRTLALDTLIRPQPDSRVVGFKEIRWDQHDLEQYVQFLRDAFPGAKFVFNSRDLDEVARSKWWAQKPDALADLKEVDGRLRSLTESLGADAYHVHFNDYVANPERLRGLFQWLGEEYDEQRVREAMAVTHSY